MHINIIRSILLSLAMSHSAYVFAQNSSIKINIQSIQTDKGHILIAVYNKAKWFP